MGSIASYQAAAGRRYRVRWRDDSTHRQVDKRGFRTKRDARSSSLAPRSLAQTALTPTPRRREPPSATSARSGCAQATPLKASSYSSLETSWRVYVRPSGSARTDVAFRLASLAQRANPSRKCGRIAQPQRNRANEKGHETRENPRASSPSL